MSRYVAVFAVLFAALLISVPATAQQAETRIALVVGNGAYEGAPIATAANDAGLIAQTLQAAGFDVVGARDLDEDALRKALRDFLDKAAASGPDTVAFVYLAGYGLQLEGETFFAPVDARIATAVDVPVAALRVSDYIKRLSTVPLKARFVVLDAARANPFVKTGEPLAGGLALVEAEPGSLIAYNAAPGTVAPPETGTYGAYAQALVEMIREGGLQPAVLFDRVRLRVNETTRGAAMPWDDARIEAPFVFFERNVDAPAQAQPEPIASLRDRPLGEIGAREAYSVAVERDTLQGYQDFLGAYPDDPMAKRVRAIVAARREATTWRRALSSGTQDAYWSYLSRYPRGPHAADARRRLARLSAPPRPPEAFTALSFDLPPPPPEEESYFDRQVVAFDDPAYALPPPPPGVLAPRPAYIVDIAAPPPEDELFALPVPLFEPVPAYVSAPAYIVAPPDNVIYRNIHNTVVINEINRRVIERPRGPSAAALIGGAAGLGAAALAARVALPPSLSHRAGRHDADPNADGPRRDRPGLPPGARDERPNDPRIGRPLPALSVPDPRAARPDPKALPEPRPVANTRPSGDVGAPPDRVRPGDGKSGPDRKAAIDRRAPPDAVNPAGPGAGRGNADPADRAALRRERIERREAARAAAKAERPQLRPALDQPLGDRAREGRPGHDRVARPGFEPNGPERVRREPANPNREAPGQPPRRGPDSDALQRQQQRLQIQEARQQQRMQMEQQQAARRQQGQAQQQQMMQRQQIQENRQQQRMQMEQQQAQRQQMQQQQQMMQRQQMQSQQQQRQAAQRQQMMQQQQQQAAQRQQRQAPPSGGNPNCHPGRPCR
ncbi:hypothetical protein ASF24_24245 [Methylobacterium sp. Leaf86]|nr:hypothetical protein ASF24_24245 [Methylobacterium sp. Leaf86]